MKDKDKKKFKLGDIIQKLNQEKSSPDESLKDDEEVLRPSDPAVPGRSSFQRAPVKDEEAALGSMMEQPRPGRDAAGRAPKQPAAPAAPFQETSDRAEEPEFDIMHYIGILVRRKNLIIVSTIIMGLFSLVGYLRAVKYYETHARMLYSPGFQDIMSDNGNSWGSWGREDEKFNTHLELLKSTAVTKRVSENLENKVSPDSIEKMVKITRDETNGLKTDIIDVAARHTDPLIARDVANQLCKVYLEYIKEVNVQDLTGLIVKLEDQMPKTQADLDQKENALREFKEKNRTVELSTQANIIITKLSGMEASKQATELDILERKERLTGLKREISQQDIDVIQSKTYSNPYQARLEDLEFQLNSLSAEYSPEHFKVRMVKNQIDKIKEAMKTYVVHEAASQTYVKNPLRESMISNVVNMSIEKNALDSRLAVQNQLIGQFEADLLKLPTIELQFAQLTRETESLVQILKMMKGRFEEAKIKRESQQSDLKILEWAQMPTSGISSVRFSKVLIGLLIGLVLGIVLAFLLEFLDQSIKDPQNLERGLELSLLGIVPMIEMEKAIIDSSVAKWKTILEPFRALRTNIKHLAATHNFKSFFICSAVKGEGKTTLAANIAITFSLDGKKVILVDGDLRRAQMHHLFNIPKQKGLSDYLLGALETDDIIKPTVHENLFVITAGEHPHNPAELVGSVRFDQLIKELRDKADFIIFDSPALLPVSDGMIMAPKLDACIMVVRALWTPLRAAQQAKNQLTRIGCTIIGSILNGISHSRGYYPYYYGYYRYYAYKYTYDEELEHAKPRWSMRELGLQVESTLKGIIRTSIFSMPQYIAMSHNFTKHLFRQKTFWFLISLAVCLPLISAGLTFLGVRTAASPKITLLGKQHSQPASEKTKGISLEAIQTGQEPYRNASPSDQNVVSPESRSDSAGIGSCAVNHTQIIASMLKDSLTLWQQAYSSRDISRFLSFYDSLHFRYPGGDFRQWALEKNALFGDTLSKATFSLDSIWLDSIAMPYFQTNCLATKTSSKDTVRIRFSMIWQYANNHWRIVREKNREES